MSDSRKIELPYGANGLDLGECVFAFARDKVVFTTKASRDHITLHFGVHSQVMDIHQTVTNVDGTITHIRLFSISHKSLAEMVQSISFPVLRALNGILRPLRLGWMAKRRIGAVLGLIPTDSEVVHVTKRRRRKLSIVPDKLLARANFPEFLEELYDLPDGQIITLFSCKGSKSPKMIGLGFKFTEPSGHRRLVWLSRRRMGRALENINGLLQNAAAKYGTFHKPLPWW